MPAPIKTRMALALARVLLLCISRLLPSAAPGSATPVGDDESGNASLARGDDSAVFRIAEFTRHCISRAKIYSAAYATRLREARQARVIDSQSELQSVLAEIRAHWQDLNERVVSAERRFSVPVKETPATSSLPGWADDVRARSRVALAVNPPSQPDPDHVTVSLPTDAPAASVVSSTPLEFEHLRSKRNNTEPSPQLTQAADSAASDRYVNTTRYALDVPRGPDLNRAFPADDVRSIPANVRAARELVGRELQKDTNAIPKVLFDVPSPGLTSVPGGTVPDTPPTPDQTQARNDTVSPDRPVMNAWPELPAENASSNQQESNRETGDWPDLPDDLASVMPASASQLATDEVAQQRILEREQRGDLWNA